jgi:alpha-1,2-mannosyltransferase
MPLSFRFVFSDEDDTRQRPAFFSLRLTLAIVSSLVEARFYRSIVEHVNARIGRYTLFILATSAGMYNASTGRSWSALIRNVIGKELICPHPPAHPVSKAFLPSTFSMYLTTLGLSYGMAPVSSDSNRTFKATACFAAAAIVGWPFSIILAIPFVFEELFVPGREAADAGSEPRALIRLVRRFQRLLTAGSTVSLIAIPILAIDSYFYGYFTFPPLNLLIYNLAGPGPELYGVEPPTFYFHNLLLNFNVAAFLAFLSLPALVITKIFDRRRLGSKPVPGQSSTFSLLLHRLAPFYVWFGVLSLQPHKEERFGFPAYPLLAFAAATTLYLGRGSLESAYVAYTRSPYRASRTSLFSTWTSAVLVSSAIVSVSRILALYYYYHAPMDLMFHLQYTELPRLAIETWPSLYPTLAPEIPKGNLTAAIAHHPERIQLDPLDALDLRLCYAKEWYRFPGHFLVPEQIDVEFVKSEFAGILPKKWEEDQGQRGRKLWWGERVQETRKIRAEFNDRNLEEVDRYVSVSLI